MFVNIVQGLLEESQDSDWLVIASILHPSVSPSVSCIVPSFLLLLPDLIHLHLHRYRFIFLFNSAQKSQLQLSACPQPQLCRQVVKMLIFFPLLNCQHSSFIFWVNKKKKKHSRNNNTNKKHASKGERFRQ